MGQVDILNRALGKIGEASITSIDDPGKTASVCRTFWSDQLDIELAKYDWNFARDRRLCTSLAEAPAFGYQYQYELPPDCLRVIQVGELWPGVVRHGIAASNNQPYQIEAGKLLTNTGPALKLIYTLRVTDAARFPALFVEVLACALAVEMCEALVGSTGKKQQAIQLYLHAVDQAKRMEAIQLPPQHIQDDSWVIAHQEGVM